METVIVMIVIVETTAEKKKMKGKNTIIVKNWVVSL